MSDALCFFDISFVLQTHVLVWEQQLILQRNLLLSALTSFEGLRHLGPELVPLP